MPAIKPKNKDGEETSAAIFTRLAKGRMTKSIRQIRTLRSLNNYEHTKVQITKMVDALAAELKLVEDALNAPKGKSVAADEFDF